MKFSEKFSSQFINSKLFQTLLSNMTIKSVEIYSQALDYLGKRGKLVGMDFLSKDYKMLNFAAVITSLDAITYTMVTIYCLFEFFGDLEKFVFCLVTYGFAVQVRFCFICC
jgi:hypothetical protein